MLLDTKSAARCVESNRNKEQQSECQQRRSTVAHKRQRDTHNGHQSDGHTHIHHQVEEQNRRHAVAVDSSERLLLALADTHQAQDQRAVHRQHNQTAHKAPLLAYRAENEVGMVLGDEVILDLRTLQEALAEQSARADSDLRLVDVEVDTLRVVDDSEEGVDTVLLVLFQHRVKEVVGRWQEDHRAYEHRYHNKYIAQVRAIGIDHHAHQRQYRAEA